MGASLPCSIRFQVSPRLAWPCFHPTNIPCNNILRTSPTSLFPLRSIERTYHSLAQPFLSLAKGQVGPRYHPACLLKSDSQQQGGHKDFVYLLNSATAPRIQSGIRPVAASATRRRRHLVLPISFFSLSSFKSIFKSISEDS